MATKEKERSPEIMFADSLALDDTFAALEGVLHRWDNTCWRPYSAAEAERMALHWLANNQPQAATANRAISAVATAAKFIAPVPTKDDGEDTTIVPTKSGYVVIERDGSMRLEPPDRQLGICYSLACDYRPDAESPKFAAFLESILPDADVRGLVQEYIGYSLTPSCKLQRAQLWLGVGANGKGTLAKIVSKLHERVSAISLEDMGGFSLTGLIGASLAYSDETPARIDEQRLKSFISGDPLQIDRKHRDPLTFRNTAKLIACANALPSLSDQSIGFWRRWHIIPFPVHFTHDQQSPNLASDIIRDELDGVLNWALEGLVRLLTRDKFPALPKAVLDAVEQGKRDTNSVAAWWDAACVDDGVGVGEQAKTPKNFVYQAYRYWCKRNGALAVSSNKFWQRLKQLIEVEEWQAMDGCQRIRFVNIFCPPEACPAWADA